MEDLIDSPLPNETEALPVDFPSWLQDQLDDRGWSRSEAARRGGISASMFDKVLNGYAKPGLDFYRGVARAFRMPLEDVLRAGGVLPSAKADDMTIARIMVLLSEQPPAVRQLVLRLVEIALQIAAGSGAAAGELSPDAALREIIGRIPPERQEETLTVLRLLASGRITIDERGNVVPTGDHPDSSQRAS